MAKDNLQPDADTNCEDVQMDGSDDNIRNESLKGT